MQFFTDTVSFCPSRLAWRIADCGANHECDAITEGGDEAFEAAVANLAAEFRLFYSGALESYGQEKILSYTFLEAIEGVNVDAQIVLHDEIAAMTLRCRDTLRQLITAMTDFNKTGTFHSRVELCEAQELRFRIGQKAAEIVDGEFETDLFRGVLAHLYTPIELARHAETSLPAPRSFVIPVTTTASAAA